MSARSDSSSWAVLWMGVSSAKRRPTLRAAPWSAWIAGSARRASSSSYSASNEERRSLLIAQTPTHEPTPAPEWDGRRARQLLGVLLGVLLLDLGVLGLELGHPAGRVEDALLARVERVADV